MSHFAWIAAPPARQCPLSNHTEISAHRRIAAILHDIVGQSMQTVNLKLKLARSMTTHGELVPETLLDELVAELGSAMGSLRTLSLELRTGLFESLPLTDAVRVFCSEIRTQAAISIRATGEDSDFLLEASAKAHCLASFREALDNAARHARARRIDVSLELPEPGFLSLTILDDGVGFHPHKALQRPTGLGLIRIQERAEQALGSARIHSKPGRGTTVRILVPRSRKEPARP